MKPCLYRLALGVMACLLVSCRATRVTTDSVEFDSIRVEVIEHIKYIIDTVEVKIPYYHDERETRDTISFLDNPFAISSASINDGVLYHSLQTVPQIFRVEFKKPTVRRDSIVYRYIYRDVKVEVEKELSWLQRMQIKAFWWLLGVVAIIILIRWVGGRA